MEKKDLEGIRWHLEQALADIGFEYGIELKLGTMRHDNFSFTATLKGRKTEVNGKSGEQLEFEKYCGKFSVPAEYYGKEFAKDGKTMRVVGINQRAKKFPVIIQNTETQEKYRMTALGVITYINKNM